MESKRAIDQSGPIKASDDSFRIAHPDRAKSADSLIKDAPSDSTRRRLTKLGLGAPVLMTLASRPVLAGQCLSNMLSGNTSPGHVHGHCSKGWSPGGWGQPTGGIGGHTTIGAWTVAGFSYGEFKPAACPDVNNPKETKFQCYANGSTLASVPADLNKDFLPSTMELRTVVADETSTALTRHLVTAYLNASLSENDPNFQYILTKQQVVDLATGALPLPSPYFSLKTFLNSTWQ